jgi:hypothetical protein
MRKKRGRKSPEVRDLVIGELSRKGLERSLREAYATGYVTKLTRDGPVTTVVIENTLEVDSQQQQNKNKHQEREKRLY